MRRYCAGLLVVVGSLALAAPEAWAGQESIVAAGCVPDPPSAQLLDTGAWSVKFKSGASGRIKLICPVTHIEGQRWINFFMFYADPDGMSTNYRVRTFFRRADLGSTFATTLCTVDSNTRAETGDTNLGCPGLDSTASSGKWYWFEVWLERVAGATDAVRFYGLMLQEGL